MTTLWCSNEDGVHREVEVEVVHHAIDIRVMNTEDNLVTELTFDKATIEDLIIELQAAGHEVELAVGER